MNLKKILLGSLVVALTAVSLAPVTTNAALNDAEFNAALPWANENGLTKYNTEAAFMPYANTTRDQASKMLASFTVTNLCEVTSSDNQACDFSDINSGDYSLKEYVMLACELGLVRGSGGKFMPTANITRAEVLTILSRAMSANAGEDAPSEDTTPWYKNHFEAMQEAGVTKETNVEAQTRFVSRYEMLLMLYRSRMENAVCSDTDVDSLLDELFGDDTTNGTGDDTTDPVVTESNGTAMAKLSSTTPNGATIPGLVSVKVASFDFTASSEAVVINEITVKRMGLGSDDTVEELTVFANNDVVSKSKSLNSDDEATFTITPAVTVQPGQTVTIDVVAKVGSAENAPIVSNQEFSIALVGFDTNGSDTTTNLPINANSFRIGGIDGAEVIVNDDGNISDVNLGDKGVEVAKFEMDNQGDSDVTITQITLEDDEKNADENLENFVLKHNGVTVGTTAKASGKYVTFTLSTPVVIGENETEDFRVYADVIAGAGDDISFSIDEETRVLGTDAKYGYGIAVDVSLYAAQTFSILAGELTLVEKKLPNDLARADRDEFVLAHFELIPNAGKDLSLEDITFVLNGSNTLGGDTWGEVFENVELQVTINGSVKRFDLNETNDTTTTLTMSDTDLGVFLKSTDVVVVKLVADTVTTFPGTWTDNNDSFSVSMSTAFPGFEIIENEDDERVTKIVPSSMTFDVVDLVTSEVDVTRLSLGDVDVVRGATNVDLIKFQVSADDAGSVYVNSFNIDVNEINACGFDPNSETISAIKLWKATSSASGSSYELLEQQGGFDISAAGLVTFDDFTEVEVLSSKDVIFLVTIDVADDNNISGCELQAVVSGADVEDDDNKDLTENGVPTAVGRTITVTSAGTLSVTFDNSDTLANRAKHVLAGTTSDFLASFELSSTNEPIMVKDLQLNVAGVGAGDFADSISEVILVKADGTEIAREQVSSTPVMFDDVNLVVNGSMNVYVKVVAKMIGKNENGLAMDDVTVALQTIDVEGENSGETVANTTTANSFAFDVLQVHLTNIAINTAGSSTTLSNSSNIVGTIEITANSWNNTHVSSGTDIEAVLNELQFIIEDNGGVITAVTVERMDITSADKICDVNLAAQWETDFSTCDAVVAQIDEGVIAKYRVRADVSGATVGDTIQLRMENLNGGDVEYTSTDAAGFGTTEDALRLSIGNTTPTDGNQITFPN
jgi:S-layer homology domain